MTKDRKRHVSLKRVCPNCSYKSKDVIVLSGMGAKFFFCPKCSPKQEAPDYDDLMKPELALED